MNTEYMQIPAYCMYVYKYAGIACMSWYVTITKYCMYV